MIAPEITERCERFVESWNRLFEAFPRYHLDNTWPSVGTVQLMLHPLRGKPGFDPVDVELVLGAAAYLVTLWHDHFSIYKDRPQIEVEFRGGKLPEFNVSIRGGKYLREGEVESIPFVSMFIQAAIYPPPVFPYFERTAIPLQPGLYSIPFFMFGLFTGLSPFLSGPWKDLEDKDLVDYIVNTEMILAHSSAHYYKHVFPSEKLGQEASFYTKRQLLVPPFGHKQEDLLTRPVFWLLARDMQEDPNLKKCLHNLATLPIQTLAVPAIISLFPIVQETDLPWFKPLAQTAAQLLGRLRGAISLARRTAGMPELAGIANVLEQTRVAEGIVTLEAETDLIPWLALRPEELSSLESNLLLLHLADGNWSGAAEECLRLAEKNPSLWVQAGLLFLLVPDEEKAMHAFEKSELAPLPDRMLPYQQLLRSCLATLANDTELSNKILDNAFRTEAPLEPRARMALVRHYLGLCKAFQRVAEGNEWLKRHVLDEELDILATLDGWEIAVLAKDLQRADALAERAISIAPNHPVAFRAHFERLVRKRGNAQQILQPALPAASGED